jgi:hypothetical protein
VRAPASASAAAPARGAAAGLDARFEREGVTLARGADRVRVSPTRFGCQAALSPVSPPSPSSGDAATSDDRITYARPELREWYRQGRGAVEQGFTLVSRPTCRRTAGAGAVEIAFDGVRGAAIDRAGLTAVVRDARGHVALRYADLHAVDAMG